MGVDARGGLRSLLPGQGSAAFCGADIEDEEKIPKVSSQDWASWFQQRFVEQNLDADLGACGGFRMMFTHFLRALSASFGAWTSSTSPLYLAVTFMRKSTAASGRISYVCFVKVNSEVMRCSHLKNLDIISRALRWRQGGGFLMVFYSVFTVF